MSGTSSAIPIELQDGVFTFYFNRLPVADFYLVLRPPAA